MCLTNRVTRCCSAPIVRHHGLESPDGRMYTIATSWDACNSCHDQWPDTIPQCDYCGESSEVLTETKLGMYCNKCTLEHSEELMERV